MTRTAWQATITCPHHVRNAFVQNVIEATCPVAVTRRTEQGSVLTDVKGKKVPQTIGLKTITREGVDPEFTLVIDRNVNHPTKASKDHTELFVTPKQDVVRLDTNPKETREKILAWTRRGPQKQSQEEPSRHVPTATDVMEHVTAA
jgi:hypothetical protein